MKQYFCEKIVFFPVSTLAGSIGRLDAARRILSYLLGVQIIFHCGSLVQRKLVRFFQLCNQIINLLIDTFHCSNLLSILEAQSFVLGLFRTFFLFECLYFAHLE